MGSNPNFRTSPTVTPGAPLAGMLAQQMQGTPPPDGYTFTDRDGVSQVAEATLSGTFNGTRDLGIIYDGVHIIGLNAASKAAWVADVAGKALVTDLGIGITNPAGNTIRVTSPDYAEHTLSPYTPDDPDLSLGAFTVTVDAVPAPVMRPGMGAVHVDYMREIEGPRADSTLGKFAGVVLRDSLLSDDTIVGLTGELPSPRALVNGQHVHVARKGRITLLAADGVTVAAGDPVYMGRAGDEAGYFYAADDGGNTRLAITGATWVQAGTGDPDAEVGLLALFT